MLWESSKMEQRYDAVLGVLRDGCTVTQVSHIPSHRPIRHHRSEAR
jgi:hypothetical protein